MNREQLDYVLNHLKGVRNVYFQPPADVKLRYPCIIYSKAAYPTQSADNHNYRIGEMYQLLAITKSPDWDVPKRLLRLLPSCKHESAYVADGLYHDRFTVHI